ncbi:tail fiber protein [Yersinia intermedia]|uniref:phage tail protein n=1 Tax=Yersinia intermedia TaxID=631 RepID=UPI0005E23890|nr:phage tail protein [Yersinia intermedia]CNH65442.1 tail fiber protein [Yersinia intermedia]
MTARFFALLTNIGAAKLANATALGTRLEITQMAVGDGGGILPTPSPAQTKLVNEQRRAALNMLTIDPINTSQIIAEQVIPETEGGWWIREIGLLDKDGDLVAIANCAETYKPQLQEGSGRTQTIRMILIVSSTAAVTLKIDPSVVLATRQYVDKKTDDKAIEVKQYADNLLTEHEKSRNHPDASKTEKGFVKLSSATTSDSEVLAATPKAVKTVADNAAKALGDHGSAANPHDQYFQIANLLSEIKALGPAALAETLANLDLGDAAKRTVGAGTNQIPDMNSFTSGTVGTPGSTGYGVWFKLPSGVYIQYGLISGNTSGPVTASFPIPFPTSNSAVFVGCKNTVNSAFASGDIVTNSTFRYAFRTSTSYTNDSGFYFAIGGL